MKVRGIFISLLVVLIFAAIFLSGCGKSDDAPTSSEKAITAYSLNGVPGTIIELSKTIAVTMPSSTNLTSLVATFTTTGSSLKVGTTAQTSGATANNFVSPLAYTVTAADGSTVNYTVTVTVIRAWHHPANLSDNISPNLRDAENAQVAVDNNGNAIIVWQQSNGTNSQIFKSEYRGGGWTNPSSLIDNISPGGQDAENPQVAMDNNGNAIIVWQQYDGAKKQIFKSEYRDWDGNYDWHYPELTDNISPDGQNAENPQVAMDDNGNAIIVWYQHDGVTATQIFKSEYRSGGWLNPSSLIDNISPDGQDAENPQVAMDDNGNAIIVWAQSNGTKKQIFKSEYREGKWPINPPPPSLDENISPDGEEAILPQVVMGNNGNAVIVWSQFDGANWQIFKSDYRNGSWTPKPSIDEHISTSGQDAFLPQVAMDNNNGNTIIVWRQSDGANFQIFKSEYRNKNWSLAPSKISPDGQNQDFPQVAMDDSGNAIIALSQSDGTNKQIFKSEYRGGAWTNPSSLSNNISPDGQNAALPQVAMDDNGNAIIVWQQSDSANLQIFKSEYR